MHIIEFVEQFPITYINFNDISYVCTELQLLKIVTLFLAHPVLSL